MSQEPTVAEERDALREERDRLRAASPRAAIYALIDAERERQEVLFPGETVAAPHQTDLMRLMVLTEEAGEVAKAVRHKLYPRKVPQNVEEELVQVAAVCVAWLEAALAAGSSAPEPQEAPRG